MLNLSLTTDKLQVITNAAANVDVHASFVDLNTTTSAVTPDRQNTAISSSTTTDVVAAPASGVVRNVKTLHVRNKHATLSVDVTVQFNQNATLFELFKATLRPGDVIEYVEGIGFFVITNPAFNLTNESVVAQGAGFASDTYLTGSSVAIPPGLPVVGTMYRMVFDVVKTAAGTAQPIVIVRFGTAGAIGDTARCTFGFTGTTTAVADTATVVVECVFRTVGAGTSAVLQGRATMDNNLSVTGFSGATPVKVVQVTSGGFDSTVANSIIGASYNGGASAAHTVQLVRAELIA